MRLLLVVFACLLCAPAAHAGTGRYLDYAHTDVLADSGGVVTIGREGVPVVHYSWGVERNPVTVATWALEHWSRGDRATLLRAARWLARRQRRDGSWAYWFDFDAVGVPMRAPWISAMAQGMAISVLVRAQHATGRTRFGRAAHAALRPFTRNVTRGGVTAQWDGCSWYEEYPAPAPQHVLNGFQFALLGLRDLDSDRARRLWRRGVRCLIARIALFDAPGSQFYAALGGGRIPVGAGYRHTHAVLTRELARLTGDRTLRRWARRWARDDTLY